MALARLKVAAAPDASGGALDMCHIPPASWLRSTTAVTGLPGSMNRRRTPVRSDHPNIARLVPLGHCRELFRQADRDEQLAHRDSGQRAIPTVRQITSRLPQLIG